MTTRDTLRVPIHFTVEVDDETRRAINLHYGRPGLATFAQTRDWFESFGRHGGMQEVSAILSYEDNS